MNPTPLAITGLSGAVLSDDRRHRLWLWRIWDRSLPILVTCMLNPSDADERTDDRTITRLCGFATRWGFGGVLVINQHSIRTPSPSIMREAAARGQSRCAGQAAAVEQAIALAREQGTPLLCAWGAGSTPADEATILEAAGGLPLICLGLTKSGAPKHPLARGRHRVPDDQQPLPFLPI